MAAAVTPTGKFNLTEASLCLICLPDQMHGILANASSLQVFVMALCLGILIKICLDLPNST